MISPADLKALLEITSTEDDDLLTLLEAAAVAFAERYTGRYFGPVVTRTEYLVGVGQREAWLSDTPAGAVAVEADGVAVNATLFTVRERRLRHASAWGSASYPADLVVTYPAGYAAGTEPADIRAAVLALVAAGRKRIRSGAGALQSETIGGYSYTLADADAATDPGSGLTARAILDQWRRWAL